MSNFINEYIYIGRYFSDLVTSAAARPCDCVQPKVAAEVSLASRASGWLSLNVAVVPFVMLMSKFINEYIYIVWYFSGPVASRLCLFVKFMSN